MLENILLIDDDATTNHVNRRLLVRSGKVKNVFVVESGAEGLELLKNFEGEGSGKKIDLILLDLTMDGMNGFDFLDAYQELPENKKARMMVALTSSASFYDLDRLKNYPDVTDHLFKPLTEPHLNSIISLLQQEENQ